MIYKALSVIGVFVFAYITFSFVLLDFNPATWQQEVRAMFAYISICCSIAALMTMSIK